MAALRGRQARPNAFVFDFVADFPRRTIDSFLTGRCYLAQFSITTHWGSAFIPTQ
jgi:hypothetical protein